ncbi:MAG: bifunctional UDP-N-acetylglucosamine diphosphorylase/glucosamine-1-phosphate N-acetyltransferase GlmU [Hyphomicrobiaceae bacterium]|nr:bifunctional UDP-N-acetylglucosamine diphosphorylase/glucosamine-1-phosphate N-acetyltransferase GlmU [Hyphomicrobiaceae bacterium]
MADRSGLAVILAAGEGTRMRSSLPKVLHPVGGLALVGHVIKATLAAGISRRVVVAGHGAEAVSAAVRTLDDKAAIAIQTERLGTAHAVLAARSALEEGADDIVVLFGDGPLITAETIAAARAKLAEGAAVVVVGFHTDAPTGYGRLLMQGDALLAIREEKDASTEERKVTFCNSGIMALSGSEALALLDAVGNANAKGEYYLTDCVEIARARGLVVTAIEADAEEVAGVNNRLELAVMETAFQKRAREAALMAGVTLQVPDTVIFSHDTVLESDVVVEPYVVFAEGVKVAAGARIRAFSHLEEADVGPGAEIGPYARLRPGSEIGEGGKVGNFVEMKKAVLGPGAKVNHLTYIGDAEIGAKANIGAGTITCNYDGVNKHKTVIGEGAFIGSNSSLVAPVTIGTGGYVGSGSVITKDVPDGALAIARGRQVTFPGKAPKPRPKTKG